MTWNKDPDKAFPAPHPREPGGLRQDILDEIADHLACAAEREEERQEEENEGAVWDRVLDRFGDPDAIARKLWWDQMRETVMREWIQTGVMVVVTIAVLAGLAMMTRLVAGVGTANDAMREAMKQVAASNEALAKAMAEQRAGNEAMLKTLSGIQGGGGEKADALELSNIEIVVRRGTPEGPPAPEVKVKLEGKGPNEEDLSVDATLDDLGRATFERLYQGGYRVYFDDPRSQLRGEIYITLFAGKGAGEHVLVAPDVEPRPVQIEMDLPAYGQDSKQLISAKLESSWYSDEIRWSNTIQVLVGHSGTFLVPAGIATTTDTAGPPESWDGDLGALGTCELTGEILVEDARLIKRSDSGEWVSERGGSKFDLLPVSEDASGVHYAVEKSDELIDKYAEIARVFQSIENVPEQDKRNWLELAASHLTESIVVGAENSPALRMGLWRDGHVYAADSDRKHFGTIATAHSAMGAANVLALALPLEPPPGGNDLVLGLPVRDYTKREVRRGEREGTTRISSLEDTSGNVLHAYVLRGDWQGTEWPASNPEAIEEVGQELPADVEPFWKVTSEALQEMTQDGALLIPIANELFSNGEQPVTGVLLRWENSMDNFIWGIEVDMVTGTSAKEPCWMVT